MGFFGKRQPDPWKHFSADLAKHVFKKLSPEGLVLLSQVLARHQPQDHIDLFRLTLRGNPERSCDAIAMVLAEQHNQLINTDESFYNSDASRAMIISSLGLCPKPWNPASVWLLFYIGRSEDEATHRNHVAESLIALDESNDRFVRLVGRLPRAPLVFTELRALPLWFAVEIELSKRLTPDDWIIFNTVMQDESAGKAAKQVLMRHIATADAMSGSAIILGIRTASQLIHLAALSLLSATNPNASADPLKLDRYTRLEQCAAKINEAFLPSRVNLALFYRNAYRSLGDARFLELAKTFATQVIRLLETRAFDLGPPHDIGVIPEAMKSSMGQRIEECRRIVGI